MSEKKAYQKFKNSVCQFGDRIDRIENVMVLGMPDVNFCIEGTEAWMEIKSPTEPKKPGTPLFGSNHKLSVDQRNWFLRQKNAEGLGLILICTDKRWILIDGCLHGDKLNEFTTAQLCQYSILWFSYPIQKIEYDGLREEIINLKTIRI